MKKNIIVIGSSKGIGAGLVQHFTESGQSPYGVSRTESIHCHWIQGDISNKSGIEDLIRKIGALRIDTLIFCAGSWEKHGFTSDFSFLNTEDEETRDIMSINAVAPIEITKALAKNFSKSDNARAIYLGSMSGTENSASSQVAYCASKFALRGAIQALRPALKEVGVGFTVINLGNVATDEVLEEIRQGHFAEQIPIPMSDLFSTVDWLMSLSNTVEVGDINLSQRDI